MGALRFALDPSLALVRSPWPIDRIWRANQAAPGAEPSVDLAAGGADLEVCRRDGDVVFRGLTAAEYTLRRALLDGECLADAADAARAVDPALDLAGLLGALVRDGLLTAFRLPAPGASSRVH
jgi:hypothetical protein